jgi:hypothetical protein
MTTKGIFVSIVMIVTVSMLFAGLLAAAEGATIWTDKVDYAPEETVTIFGSGFNADAAVTGTVTRPDGVVDPWTTTADSAGNFEATYPLDGITGTYTVTATDGTNTATTTFTDVKPIPTIVTIAFSPSSPVTAGTIVTITGTVVNSTGDPVTSGAIKIDEYKLSGVGVEHPTAGAEWDTIASGTPDSQGNFSYDFDTTGLEGTTIGFRNHYVPAGGSGYLQNQSDPSNLAITEAFISYTVSGYKHDTEGNPLDDWTITLSRTGDSSTSVLTGAGEWPDGYYEFTVTAPDEYTINETLEAAWTATSPVYQVGDPVNSMEVQGYSFTATSGDADITDMNFTNFEWLTVSGIKEDTEDNGLPGWTIKLYHDSAEYASTTTVETTGAYSFTVKDPGNYSIGEVLQAGWTAISPSYQVGDPLNTTEVEGYNFTAVSGTDVPDQNFINFEWLAVSGYKFFDANGDGYRDAGEPGLQYWVIKLDENGTQDLPNVTTDSTGYYAFTIKDPGTYTVSEIQKPPMWLCTTPPGGAYTFTTQSGTNVTADFGNWLGSSSFVTTSGLCYFDVDGNESNGRQFKLIFTPDVPEYPNKYRLTASNPGQFYYNIFYTGSENVNFTSDIPYPFVTQGAVPIHVYSSLNTGSGGCLIPGTDNTSQFTISPLIIALDDWGNKTFGNTTTITMSGESAGFLYINIHLDYGLKKTGELDKGSANNAGPICDNQIYNFSATESGGFSSEDEIKNLNVLKRDPGFMGLVTDTEGNPCEGVTVVIYGPDGTLLATVATNNDGWYCYDYKHTGKATSFIIKLPDYNLLQPALLKANKFVVVNFQIPMP